MALGFGFNKAKSLGAAEKYVQQGKLQNAIVEYDKIAKQDPKDLTVLNTIGDLYARLGQASQATEAFKKVGDAYAADGFVVKAIAMYKKLTKLNPSALDSLVRLAELYTQQGLYNDARTQYAAVADQYLKSNDSERATGILKKMLDLDPENAAMQAKVADLYLKLGRNQEAREIFFNAAQSLYQRGAVENAEEALEKVHKLDAKFAPALLLRGQIAMEKGNGSRAIESLSKLSDLDSRPEALRPLLQAYVQAGDFEKADPIAAKLVQAHNDLSAISLYAEALFSAQKPEQAMSVYERNADKLLAGGNQTLLDALQAGLSKARESAPALQSMLTLLQKVGAPGHLLREVQESLAHACVQAGELQKAADLYQELAKDEPENPLHDQNYRQVIARLGKDSATRELSVEEGGQALMVDELEAAPAVMQEYPRDLAEAINSALTDSELFSSYNVPEKAVTPLEQVLPQAPNDVRLRQRLASLYARVERFADAAQCCTVLADVHAVAGFTDQALQYREMAAKYNEQAAGIGVTEPTIGLHPAPSPQPRKLVVEKKERFEASAVRELSINPSIEAPIEPPLEQQPSVAELDLSSVSENSLVEPPGATPPPADTTEADTSHEWEEMLTVEEPAAEAALVETNQLVGGDQAEEITYEETPDEILEEARFYLSQGMNTEAQSAISRLEMVAPDHPALDELRHSAGMEVASVQDIDVLAAEASADFNIASAPPQPEVEQIATSESEATSEAAVERFEKATAAEEIAAQEEADILGDLDEEEPAEEVALDELMPEVATGEPASLTSAPSHIPPRVPAVPSAVPAPAMSAAPAPAEMENPLAGMVSDLEDVLEDIVPPKTQKPAASVPQPVVAAAPSRPAPAAAVQVSVPEDNGEAQSMLSDLLDEFKEGIEEPAADADDPDTHYNLGVAFREMGLLDEAIGELQKVCRALDSGKPFSQPIQAYTWLAQCLVDKGAAQAAIRWYERALQVKGIGEDSRVAVYYDMANAFESAGNKKAALDNFMEVYGLNIDYRDVADRIRSLRQ